MPRFAKVFSAELEGIQAKIIEVEVDLHVGLHSFQIVGLADKALNEAKERVSSAIKNSGCKPPNRENRKITVNLAPADIKKTGSQYDLAISIGYLTATDQIKPHYLKESLFVGELALDGAVRPTHGALNIAELCSRKGFNYLFLPKKNAEEASVINGVTIVPVESLAHAIEIVEKKTRIPAIPRSSRKQKESSAPDFADIRGQETAKRSLTIAAAGGHNLLMVGPPGVGKSMMAQALAGILPDLTLQEAIDVTKIWSAAGLSPGELFRERPFRAPHQTASQVAVIGGGTNPRPGEISLAHKGILFLDELPEFPKNVLEALRAPMESGVVRVARAKQTLTFPSQFVLVAAMNPCPCGYYGDPEKECRCGAHEVLRYQKKISGPLLDRIDIQLAVPRVPIEQLRSERKAGRKGEAASSDIKETVARVRAIQRNRFSKENTTTNSEMSSKQTEAHVVLTDGAEALLTAMHKNPISPRSYYKILKVARTIADLDASENVTDSHLAEAFSYRLKGELWG